MEWVLAADVLAAGIAEVDRSPGPGIITGRVIKAYKLRDAHRFGKSDPYVIVFIPNIVFLYIFNLVLALEPLQGMGPRVGTLLVF